LLTERIEDIWEIVGKKYIAIYKNQKINLIDKDINLLWEKWIIANYIHDFNVDWFVLIERHIDEKEIIIKENYSEFNLVNIKGELLLSQWVDNIENFNSAWYARIKKDKKWNMIDKEWFLLFSEWKYKLFR